MTWGVNVTWWEQDGSTAAALTNKSLRAAPGAGKALYITDIHISNEGAANVVELLDGADGTALWGSYMPTNTTENAHLVTPIKLTANTALCATTTAADHMMIMVGGYTDLA